MPTGAALMTPPVQGCSSLLKRIVARLKTDGMAQVPRRYGDKPSYREVAYEVLFMNKGKPLHVRDILQAAQKQSLLEGPVPEKAWNTLASKLNNDNLGRFRRVEANTFGLASFSQGVYQGNFRRLRQERLGTASPLSELKVDRRSAAAAAGEISDRALPPPATHMPAEATVREAVGGSLRQRGVCGKDWGPNDAQMLRIQALVREKLGFEWELRAVVMLRQNRFTDLENALKDVQKTMNNRA